ncbi:hypothetical protein MLD38_012330 [Melastoma candidum]|uniref:Uncharacterized protein n=1 Tax=Melastoma candidum TaxID=119954 RepID=A0ACB9R605_9MYRT|nr:hypothetical protein MLD38_012330 [Melastoma candidum]
MEGAREMECADSPSLSPFLHPTIKSPSRETHEGIEEEKARRMEQVSRYGYCYGYDVPSRASLFSVFESTGDSLVDARPPDGGAVAMEEDDAESCSYDDLGSEHSEEGCCEGGNAEEGGDVRRDEVGGGGRGLGRYKPCVSSGESKGGGVDLMNEMERNKLFWEACLAS